MNSPEGGLDRNKDKKRAGPAVIAGLAGALVAGGAANAQELTTSTEDYSAPEQYTDNYGSYESSASPEALAAVDALIAEVGPGLSIDPDKVRAMVKAYVGAHAPYDGRSVTTEGKTSTEASYSPFLDLRQAVEHRSDGMNPLLLGLLWQELNRGMKEAPVGKSE